MLFIRLDTWTTAWIHEQDNRTVPLSDAMGVVVTNYPLLGQVHVVDQHEPVRPTLLPTASRAYSVPILKSNIQKTFRRRLPGCLPTVRQLLRQDPSECLRRLPIVLVENGSVNAEGFSILVWLMAAHSKGYRLTVEDEETILRIVHQSWTSPHTLDPWTAATDSAVEVSCSFYMRAAYGGMDGDQRLLIRCADTAKHLSFLPPPPSLPEEVQAFDPRKHMTLEAIDFHCSSVLTSVQKATGLAASALREAMWEHWSAPNVRKPTSPAKRLRRWAYRCGWQNKPRLLLFLQKEKQTYRCNHYRCNKYRCNKYRCNKTIPCLSAMHERCVSRVREQGFTHGIG